MDGGNDQSLQGVRDFFFYFEHPDFVARVLIWHSKVFLIFLIHSGGRLKVTPEVLGTS
jgi:hypothetical protein